MSQPQTITFQQFLNLPSDETALFLVALHTVPDHMEGDLAKRNVNVAAGELLCKPCDGTGNEFFSMYRRCSACNGSGKRPEEA